jgi:hypothetical protein
MSALTTQQSEQRIVSSVIFTIFEWNPHRWNRRREIRRNFHSVVLRNDQNLATFPQVALTFLRMASYWALDSDAAPAILSKRCDPSYSDMIVLDNYQLHNVKAFAHRPTLSRIGRGMLLMLWHE